MNTDDLVTQLHTASMNCAMLCLKLTEDLETQDRVCTEQLLEDQRESYFQAREQLLSLNAAQLNKIEIVLKARALSNQLTQGIH